MTDTKPEIPPMNEDTDAVVTVMINDEEFYNECLLFVRLSKKSGGIDRLTRQIYGLKRNNYEWLKAEAGGWPDMRKVSARRIAEYFWYEEE